MKKYKELWSIVYMAKQLQEVLLRNEQLENEVLLLKEEKERWMKISMDGEKVRGELIRDLILCPKKELKDIIYPIKENTE